MKKTILFAIFFLTAACLWAGGQLRTSLSGSFAVSRGKTSSGNGVESTDYELVGAGGGFCLTGVSPSGLAFFAGADGLYLPGFSMKDRDYRNYKEGSSYWGEMWTAYAGAGKEFRITDRLGILAGGGMCVSRIGVDVTWPVLNISGSYRLSMINLGLCARTELCYRFCDDVALVLGADVSLHAYNIASAKELIAPPGGAYCLFKKDVASGGWSFGAGVRASLGFASFY